MQSTLRLLFLLLGWAALRPVQVAWGQNACASPGRDGTTFSAAPNSYYPGAGTAGAGTSSLGVGSIRTGTGASAAPIAAGDLLLVIQMQGADINSTNTDSYGDGVAGGGANGNLTTNFTAGQYEYVVANSGVNAGSVALSTALKNTYVTSTTAAANGTATIRTFQVVRVPQYRSLTLTGTITPAAWDGSTGGIVALDVAGAINFNNNTINASGAGFRGGAGRVLTTANVDNNAFVTTSNNAATDLNAQKGEGTAGTPRYVNNGGVLFDRTTGGYPNGGASRGAPGNAGGGANDNTFNSGGGGGANGGTGGRGGNNYQDNLPIGGEPGAAYAIASGTSLVLGGGGGAGTNNDNSGGNNGFASSGSAGGGIVLVRAGSVAGTGTVTANGATPPTGVLNDGGGGGGAGGSILITALAPGGLSGLTLNANGAAGASTNPGNNNTQHGPGGGGGGGIIYTNGTVNNASSVNGGASGVTTYGTLGLSSSNYGAAAGAPGVINTSLNIANVASTGGTSGATCSAISGTIFSDTNFGGGAGRSYSTANASAVASGAANNAIASVGTTVELYDNVGTFVATTTTTAGGAYTFTGLTSGASYTVRVVNSTVKSARTPGATGVVPVQTFRTTAYTGTGLGSAVADVTRVGGEAPELQDAAARSGTQTLGQLTASTATPQSITSVTPGTSGVDFGFNFDLVVNTNDAGQGSLRQFILNANALGSENLLAQAGSYTNTVNLAAGNTAPGQAGVALPAGYESSIFMIPNGTAVPGQRAGLFNGLPNKVAIITPASALPQLTGVNTVISGATQTFNIGNTNDVLLGNGGTVGTQAAALSRLSGPEVQLVGNANIAIGLNVAGAGSRLRGLAIYGFGNGSDDDNFGNIVLSANNIIVADNAIGSAATSFAVPPVANGASNVRVVSGTGDSFTNNLIGFAGGTGIRLASGVTGTSIVNNEIRGNARLNTILDGVDSHGSSTTVTNNLFADNAAQGFDSFSSTGSNNVTGNTFTNNGIGNTGSAPVETAAARFYGTGNTFSQNISAGNYGAGVEVVNGATTTISRNSIYNNGNVASANGTAATGQVGIDLTANGANENLGNSPYVTLNSAATNGGNGLLNYPVITSAVLSNSNLVVSGYAKANAVIELFTAQPNPASVNATGTNFGQGRTYLTTVTEGTNDADARTGLSYSGTINGFNQGTDTNANGFTFTIPLSALPGGTLPVGTVLTSTATLNGATSEFSGNATLSTFAGYVYEDVNYGGGAGRPRSASGTSGRPSATVELYSGTTLVGTTTTDATGQYTFGTTPGTYTVRVVNSTVSSSRTGYVAGLLPVQTYNGTTTAVGGANPAFTDAAANTGSQTLGALTSGTTTPQSIATITTTNAATAGPDFGFNFDVVVNTNDAGQGSLRQFITNANALGGEASLAQAGSNSNGTLPAGRETSIFMIPSGQLTNGVAAIAPTSALPAITGALTSIDGTTQTVNIGNTNNVALGAGGTVGTAATALSQLNGPEVQLKGTNSFNGLSLTADNTTVRGLSLYGFDDNIVGGPNNTGTLIEQNIIGASATSFTDPGGTNRTLNEGIDLNGSDNGIVRNNLIGFNGGMGIWVANSFNDASNGANGNTISNNEVRSNALLTNAGNGERLVFDGLELQGTSTGNTVSGNLITANTGHGIDSFGNNIGGNTITGNTVSNNGLGVANNTGEEGSGLRVFGAANPTLISGNVLSGNNGSGVLVIGSANQVAISQNSTFNNTRLGIDLLVDDNPPAFYNGNTGSTSNVTLNDNGDGDTGGNGLLNFPVITSATILNGNLVVQGFARPGAAIELFTPSSTANGVAANVGFGQGQTYLGTFTEGSGADTDSGTGTYAGLINGLDQGTDNTNRFSFTIPLTGNFAAYAAGSQLTSTATLSNSTSEFSGNVTVTNALAGYVYEDVNYGGGAGRPRSASGTSGRPGARVELYDASGTFVAATTTDATGQYAFNVPAAAYTVRVVNSTVTSSRTGYVAGLLPVQTYNGTTTRVGGENPAKVDAGNGAAGTSLASLNTATTIAESQATLTLGTGTTAGPDFGFNFDVVVNTNDAGQGSLRQFITNANALGGENLLAQAGSNAAGTLPAGVETSIFMIPNGVARPGLLASNNGGPASQLTNGAALITLSSTLANISGTNGANTSLDGSTQTFNIGNTNAAVTTAGSESTGPEVVINFNNTNGFGTSAANTRIIGLGLTGANSGSGSGAAALRVDNGASNSLILNNTFYSNGANFRLNSVNGVTVTGNISRNATFADSDGIELSTTSNSTITNNQFLNNAGFGIDFIAGPSNNNTLTGNIFSGNGQNTTNGQTAGIGLRATSSNNIISGNTFTGNVGDGISATAGTGNTFSQNSFYGNGNLAIDLANGGALNGDGVTLNDSGDGDTGANGLLNFPVITSATILNGNLVVQGFARPGSAIELYNPGPAADPTNFGEGQTYLGTFTEGSAADTDTGTGTYSGTQPNGLNEGTDNTNRFSFTIPLTGRFAGYTFNSLLSSTATLSGSTSEFGGNVRVITAPVPNDATNASIASNAPSPVTLNPSLSGTAYGNTQNVTTNTANAISYYTIASLPTSGTLYYNGTALTSGNLATTQVANPALLSYLPTRGFSGNATFTYTATDADGLTSTQHNTSGTVANGPATYTIPVAASADVTASLTGSTTLTPGQPTGYYTATFTNLGPDGASGVNQTITLPTGASLSPAQQVALTGTYSGTSFVTTGTGTSAVTTITFANGNTTLASGAVNAYRFAFTAPTTAGSSTLAANVSTTSSEGANVAANATSLALTTVPVVDLQATVSVGFGTVSPGSTASFTATFTNLSAPTATGVVETVQLAPGLTGLTVSGQTGTPSGNTVTFANGAVYNSTTGLLTYATTTLPTGSVSSVITFTMPASGVVTATAGLSTATTEPNLGNNVQSISIVAGPRFDLATTLSGPTSAVAGSPVTLSLTTTNNSGQAVTGAVQTVQLPAGLNPAVGPPGVFVSNGGTYDNASGQVTFPALGSLPAGQTVANTITFLAPSAAFTPSAQVTPNTVNAGDTNPANNTAYLNGAASSTATGATLTPNPATTAVANLTATLTTTSTIVNAATQVSFTVGASNAGPGAAANVTGHLQLLPGLNATTLLVAGAAGTLQPDGVTYNFANGANYQAVSYNSQTGLLSYAAAAASLASGASFSLPVTLTVPATVGNDGQLLATNSVGSATSDNVPADNVKAVTVAVRPASDLVAALTGPTSSVVPGQSVTYTATFTNNGPSTARATAQTVQLPTGLTASTLTLGGQSGSFNSATNTVDFANGASYNPATGLVTLPALASDAAGAVQAFYLTFVAPAQSYVVSAATSSGTPDPAPANNAASVATTVTPTTDVAVALAGPTSAVIGNYVTYTLTTTNNGPNTATGVVPTLRLPAGLTIQSAPAGYSYDASGLLTFPAIASLQAGVSAESYVTFTMPNATGGQLSALASVSSGTLDNVLTNNTAAATTSVAPASTPAPAAATTADLLTSISPTGTSAAPGGTVTYTAAYRNNGTLAATGVVPTVSLPTGLAATDLQVGGVTGTLANGLITFGSGPAAGATYDVATGLLTFPTIASLPYSATATSYSVAFSAPASGQLVVVSTVTSNTTDLNPADNRSNSSITVNSAFDLTTSVAGPVSALAGSQNVYTIKTTNNGPSTVSSATQTVALPSGLTTSTLLVAGQTGTVSGNTISFSNSGASYDTGSGLLTFAGISNLAPGAGNAVSNTITVTMPASGSLTVGNASVSTTAPGETNTTNNTASFTTVTAPLSFAPVAQNIVNSLRSPEGNTANALAISPLFATDSDGSISNYYIQSLPTSGTLYYNGAAIGSIPSGGYQVANPALLSFDPANTFAGDVFFTYTATDNNGVASNPALYTIPVAQDIASAYTAYNTAKGGANTYKTNDVLAQVIDPNKAVYTSAGTIFDATTGTLQAGAANGLLTSGTNAVLAATGPSGNTANTLPAGVSLDPATGRIYVSDASQLANNSTARTYSVFVITTDANGGISQALATFTIGAFPLPVVLVDFTAQAVANRDALLRWHTASEKNNDHFDIERSLDGVRFAKIGQVAGHGTTSAASAYAFTDAGVAAQATGPVYYRLRQVDLDGTSSFSPVRSVGFTTSAAPVALSLYPNPAQASTKLDLSQLPATGSYQVQLLDATGRLVLSRTLAGGLPQPLNVHELASGAYLVRVSGQTADGTAFQQTLRLTKE